MPDVDQSSSRPTPFAIGVMFAGLAATAAAAVWRAPAADWDLPLFAVGFVVSFIAAWICVRWLLRYVSTHTFVPFAWYRIAFGLVVLATAWSGLVVWQD